jgi:nucleotide-binding universal stress UspA family protein
MHLRMCLDREEPMYRSILLALDGSPFAEGAAPVAARLAAASHATLHLVVVHEWLSHWMPLDPTIAQMTLSQIDEHGRRESKAYLGRLAAELRADYGIRVRQTVLEGIPTDEIRLYATRQHIDLVVMTTHGRGGLSRLWLGSVADTLVRQLDKPVLLCRGGTAKGPVCTMPFRRILVPLDGSVGSERALDMAADLSEAAPGSSLGLMMVVSPHYLVFPEFGVGGVGPEVTDAAQRGEYAREYLATLEARLASRGIESAIVVDVAGDVARAIFEEARRTRADVIAIATRGRGGVPRMVIGSVADKVIRAADQPVLVCRSAGRASRLAPAYARAIAHLQPAAARP